MGESLLLDKLSVWKEYYNRMPIDQQDVYFTPEYYSLYQDNGDGEARCFVFEEDGDLVLYPFLINPISMLGYNLDKEYYDIQGAYGYNGIVASSKDPAFIAHFHKAFDIFCRENDIIAEFSRFHPLLKNWELASPNMKIFYSRKTVLLDLSLSFDNIWMNSFTSKNRNIIKKTIKDGVEVIQSKDYEFFCLMYDQTMRNLNAEGFYFFPKVYYDKFQKLFGEDLILCFAMYNGFPIAGSLFIFSKNYAHYHLSARNKDYYKIAANNVILLYGIQLARRRGCKCFHFGGGTTGEVEDMLLHFKQQFSKENGEFWIGKRIHNQNIYNSVVAQWKEKYPKSYEKNELKLLGYREI